MYYKGKEETADIADMEVVGKKKNHKSRTEISNDTHWVWKYCAGLRERQGA
jgi:hypothetical protein